MNTKEISKKTIDDFSKQWLRYRDNNGFYGSIKLFKDIISPLLRIEELKGLDVCEIGSGTGRIVKMLLDLGVKSVIAIEPSDSYYVLVENLKNYKNVKFVKGDGSSVSQFRDLDIIFSIGVIHHIPEPEIVIKEAYKALKKEGRIFIWVYAKEGNEKYLKFIEPLRKITTKLPHFLLVLIVEVLYWFSLIYGKMTKIFRLPLSDYFLNIFNNMSPSKKRLIIYDQLNPLYAKYYTEEELIKLLSKCGFKNIKTHHRHNYSWSAIATK